MPNWCATSIAVIAYRNVENSANQLRRLHSIFTSPVETQDKADPTWIGNYLYALGIIPDKHESGFRSFLSYVDDVKSDNDMEYFTIETEDAWGPKTDAFDLILSDPRFDRLQYVYIAEEPGCGVYINTDEDGIIFRDRYKIEYYDSDDMENEYCETEEEYLRTLDDWFGICAKSYEESENMVRAYNKNNNRGIDIIAVRFENPNI